VVSLLTSAACAVCATANGLEKIAAAATNVVVNFRIGCLPTGLAIWFRSRYAKRVGKLGGFGTPVGSEQAAVFDERA
jgi:hypothetical protein